MAFIDTDEFLVTENRNIPMSKIVNDLFEPYYYLHIGGIAVNWRVFGTNHHETKQGGLVIENYTSYGDVIQNRHIKSIVDPRTVDEISNPHYPIFKFPFKECLQNGKIIDGPFNQDYGNNYHPIRLHHYVFKSREEYVERMRKNKAARIRTSEEIEVRIKEWLSMEDQFNTLQDTYLRDWFAKLVRENMIKNGYNPDNGQRL